ncbi:MAG TPA: VOC family protein [Thermomicrobiales bacterium]|jgi:hypothetical protein|nr:VOC family protein [Thermomicrobiales bacterium]
MKSSIKVVTLAVEDLERSLAFYRDGLGFENEACVPLGERYFDERRLVAHVAALGHTVSLDPAR